ncbi:MAG: hypothetical protein DI535_22115 [Citrobacter freundii]|nr:MAG: hypothetical protein DI535_22115 [Citrobacter freundii]
MNRYAISQKLAILGRMINLKRLAFIGICLAFVSAGAEVKTIRIYVTGQLKKNPTDTSAPLFNATVFVRGNNKILAKTVPGSKGNFNIDFLDQHESSFDFYYTNAEKDTLLLLSTSTFKSDNPKITFSVPAMIKKNKAGQVICLKCKRADKVIKIRALAKFHCDRDNVNF